MDASLMMINASALLAALTGFVKWGAPAIVQLVRNGNPLQPGGSQTAEWRAFAEWRIELHAELKALTEATTRLIAVQEDVTRLLERIAQQTHDMYDLKVIEPARRAQARAGAGA